MIKIDGSLGEGGGQVLRTALTLSMLSQQPIEVFNIRAGRRKPGLLRQHLTSLKAAQTISAAKVTGAELGSTHITFIPAAVKGGEYHFSISTAGSTVLVCQTVLPVLALAESPSVISFEGGTHNGLSPSLTFLTHAYLPVLATMGVKTQVEVEQLGFFPAGGGKWQLALEPTQALKAFELSDMTNSHEAPHIAVQSIVSRLPRSVAEREISTVKRALQRVDLETTIHQCKAAGTGNSLHILVETDTHCCVFDAIGQHGVQAERIAKHLSAQVKLFLQTCTMVDEYLADQLLVPMAIAKNGSFTTTKPSSHTLTNIMVINDILGCSIQAIPLGKSVWKIEYKE